MRIVLSLVFTIAAFGISGCRDATRPARDPPPLVMGTTMEIVAGREEVSRQDEYYATARGVMGRIEKQASLYSTNSEIAELNRQAGIRPVVVNTEISRMLCAATNAGLMTGGAFDVTVGPLVKALGFSGGRKPDHLPDTEQLKRLLSRIGYRHLEAEVVKNTARLELPGMVVDLGGIAKGYAVDRAMEQLRRDGGRNFLVNLGGNMCAAGSPVPERPWRVGVRNPFDRAAIIGMIDLADGMAVSTSGNYERFVTIDGRRYAHIIDPRSGQPVEGMAGVTVVCDTAMMADVMSTALFVHGITNGVRMLANCPAGIEALFVPDSQPVTVVMTPGMARIFIPQNGLSVRVLTP